MTKYDYCMISGCIVVKFDYDWLIKQHNFSARSRVKGYLEIYHAFLPDSPEIATPSAESSMDLVEREWEIVHDGREESAAVSHFCVLLILSSISIYT